MHYGCTRPSISRSHTLPLSSSIRLIAENGHVVTPQFRESGLEFVPIGVNEASTFPGFCEEHEKLFAAFEMKNEMTEADHFRLQAFRTLCRELYTKRHHQMKVVDMLGQYRRLRDEFVIGRMKKADAGKSGLNVIAGLQFENDPIETKLVEWESEAKAALLELDQLYRGILSDLQNGTETVAMVVTNFDMQLVVALSGLGVLNYLDNEVRKQGLCFLAILPESGKTKLMIGALAEHERAVKLHFEDLSSPAILEKLESWLIHGSDHWFMTPSAWAAIPPKRQRAICERILELLSLAHPVPFSVLDAPRERIVRFIEAELARGAFNEQDAQEARKIQAREKAKLAYDPPT